MKRVLETLVSGAGAAILVAYLIWPPLQFALFPVVDEAFVPIVEVRRDEPRHIRIYGEALKHYDCPFDGIRWYHGVRHGGNVAAWHKWEEAASIKKKGLLTFGPLLLQVSWQTFTRFSFADVYHRCTWFWFPLYLPTKDGWELVWHRFAPRYRSRLYN